MKEPIDRPGNTERPSMRMASKSCPRDGSSKDRFARISRSRRLARDFRTYAATADFIHLAMIRKYLVINFTSGWVLRLVLERFPQSERTAAIAAERSKTTGMNWSISALRSTKLTHSFGDDSTILPPLFSTALAPITNMRIPREVKKFTCDRSTTMARLAAATALNERSIVSVPTLSSRPRSRTLVTPSSKSSTCISTTLVSANGSLERTGANRHRQKCPKGSAKHLRHWLLVRPIPSHRRTVGGRARAPSALGDKPAAGRPWSAAAAASAESATAWDTRSHRRTNDRDPCR